MWFFLFFLTFKCVTNLDDMTQRLRMETSESDRVKVGSYVSHQAIKSEAFV
jgi:hypothetical protein